MIPTEPGPPSRHEIEARFVAILDGSQSRDEVDRWATEMMLRLENVASDDAVWCSLQILSGIDLRHGPNEPYLHDDEQLRSWLTEFRRRSTPAT